jgi:valyl-tRNA synthetase
MRARSLRSAQAIVEDLEAARPSRKVEDYTVSLAKCQRCKSVVEPLVSKQWFVRTKPLAEKAIAAVDEKRIEIVPEVWVKTWNEWMHNIRDWCISRQLWWGHRIPVWYCENACTKRRLARPIPPPARSAVAQ